MPSTHESTSVSADPTELGTYLDAFKCAACGEDGGLLVSVDCLDWSSDFSCESCSGRVPRQVLQAVEDEIGEGLDFMNHHDDPELLEAALDLCLEKGLHSGHYLTLAVKKHLSYVYGRRPGFLLHQESHLHEADP